MKAKTITIGSNHQTATGSQAPTFTKLNVWKALSIHSMKLVRFTGVAAVFAALIYFSRAQGDLFLSELVISGIIVICLFLLND